MAITSYSTLLTAISSFAHRTDDDFTNARDDFIDLAESRLYDLLLLKDMETESSLVAVVGQNYIALPAGYISPIALWIVVDTVRVLVQPVLPQQLPYNTDNTRPCQWAIDGENIRFDSPSDDTYAVKFRHIASSALSNTNTSNYLLERRPDVYLAACMVEASRWTQDVEMFNSWESRLQDGLKAIKAAENRARGMVTLKTDVPYTRQSSNIITGE